MSLSVCEATAISARGQTKLKKPDTSKEMLEKIGSSVIGSCSFRGCGSREWGFETLNERLCCNIKGCVLNAGSPSF